VAERADDDIVDLCNGGDTPHPFEPGVDVDDPDHPDPGWCNVCGERRAPATPDGGLNISEDPDTGALHVVARPEGGELDDLLARADKRAGAENRSTYADLDAPLIRDLASALRSRRDKASEFAVDVVTALAKVDLLERELAEVRDTPRLTEDDLPALRQAIADPGHYLPRGDNYEEPIHAWSARAVLHVFGVVQAAEGEEP
jgi:hypothetical protein